MRHFTGNIPWAPDQAMRGIGNAAPSREISDEEAVEVIKSAVSDAVSQMGLQLDQIQRIGEQQRLDIAMLQKEQGVTVNSQTADPYDTLPE